MNTRKEFEGFSRRRFISQAIPVCSLACFGGAGRLWGLSPSMKKVFQEEKHKFDAEFPQKLTYRQLLETTYGREFIPFLKELSDEIGKEKVIALLEKRAAVRGAQVGAMMAKQFKGTDFPTWKRIMSPDNPNFKASLTMSITESNDKVHELKVTECIWAEVFLKADAGELGNAAVCHGDYAMATGFNPKLRMVRDKTLTLGHSYCNHRYIFEG